MDGITEYARQVYSFWTANPTLTVSLLANVVLATLVVGQRIHIWVLPTQLYQQLKAHQAPAPAKPEGANAKPGETPPAETQPAGAAAGEAKVWQRIANSFKNGSSQPVAAVKGESGA